MKRIVAGCLALLLFWANTQVVLAQCVCPESAPASERAPAPMQGPPCHTDANAHEPKMSACCAGAELAAPPEPFKSKDIKPTWSLFAVIAEPPLPPVAYLAADLPTVHPPPATPPIYLVECRFLN